VAEAATIRSIDNAVGSEIHQKNDRFKKFEEILETSRSGLILLRISHLGAHRPVSRSRQKPQEISP
jgi:hypothetical protein